MVGYLFLAILAFSVVAYFVGRREALAFARGHEADLHSRPVYHGAFVAIWVGLPTLILVFVWLAFEQPVVDRLLVSTLPPEMTTGTPAKINLLVSQIKNAAGGRIFGKPGPEILAAAERYADWQFIARWAMVVGVMAVMILGLVFARRRLAPRFRARTGVERIMSVLMIFCSVVAILTTIGIIASLLFEAWRFFSLVPLHEFLFGLRWEPQIAIRPDQVASSGAFGAIPIFTGTLLIATIAMVIAVPIGLFSAIYLTEYAGDRFRAVVKPILEVLAGIPTVVYGFFAILVIAPAIRDAGGMIGLAVSPNSALAAGLVMGVMIIPFISSLADDAITAVPRSMRDGSFAMGATRGETITKVLVPAALPGITGGILLAMSRAIGETMIVVMAAGLIANLTANPLDAVTTVTVQIVTLLTGDTSFDDPKTLAAFALGLMLFLVTLCLNITALWIVRKYRERYE